MVRFKKRYFVVQFDREKDIFDERSDAIVLKKTKYFKPRVFQNPKPLDIPDGVLASAVKDIVEHLHGDFGRAAITTGLRTIYCNPETHLAVIQCRHGPHRLVGSSLPFLTNLNNEKVVPKLIYTGATIHKCFKRIEIYQRKHLEIALKELQGIDDTEKKALEDRLMTIRQ